MITFFLVVFALVLFLLAALRVQSRVDLVSTGLAALTLALLVHLWPVVSR